MQSLLVEKVESRHEGEEVRYKLCRANILYQESRKRVERAAESEKGRAQRERLRRGKHEARTLNQTRTT